MTFFTAGMTRPALALADLNLNDGINFRVASIAPGNQAWRRQTTSSPYVDGVFTTNRSRDIRQLQITIDALGADDPTVIANVTSLVAAMDQDYFEIYWAINGSTTRWAGEAADRQNDYSQERVRARRYSIVWTIPVQPIALAGAL